MSDVKVIEDFHAGRYENGYDYKFFVPSSINCQWQWADGRLNELLEKASIRVGELNSFAKLVPNIDLFIHLHVTREAVISSRIEGTQTTINEALLSKDAVQLEKRDDWQEVQNYTKALSESIDLLESLPLSTRLIRNAHGTLMQGVRGERKTPGDFRSSQNWIGGASLADAEFIPPAYTYVNELMGDLENFLHNRQIHVPALIRIAIIHYQFETIHPFLDGNGRIGRLLITLFLVSEKILESPLLYLSIFFESDKSLYYENLTKVREKNDLLGWLRYFLVGIESTAARAVDTLKAIMILKADIENEIRKTFGKRSNAGLQLLNELFKDPVVSKNDVQKKCGLSKMAAHNLVNAFEQHGLLKEMTGKARYQIFYFHSYLRLFE